ncbi:MAG: ornithine carbamoyltransferase [Candidatus Caldatribacteriota bacterium]
MSVSLRNRHLLTLKDFNKKEISFLLDLAVELKKDKYAGKEVQKLKGKNIALIFEKPSTRTRSAFEVAAHDQGANITYLEAISSHIGKKESMEDTARVLGRYFDGIGFRGFKQESVEILAKYSGAVVWNALTDTKHPTQAIADLMTIKEKIKKPLEEIVITCVGDGRANTSYSLMIISAIFGIKFRIVSPKLLYPDKESLDAAKRFARESGGTIELTDDILRGVKGADVIYTDVWVSMGEEYLIGERILLLKEYQVDMNLLQATGNPEVIFLHPLPSFHDTNTKVGGEVFKEFGLKSMEVTDEAFRSEHSVVFDEAENKLHTIKAIMTATLGD